jgi:hypothetical protein
MNKLIPDYNLDFDTIGSFLETKDYLYLYEYIGKPIVKKVYKIKKRTLTEKSKAVLTVWLHILLLKNKAYNYTDTKIKKESFMINELLTILNTKL